MNIPSAGLRLRFDGPDQRLRLIEVLDFSKSLMVYHNVEVVRRPKASEDGTAHDAPVQGPSFRHVYQRLVGPAYEGEYVAPDPGQSYGIYVLSYPGLAFSFPIKHKSWSAKADFVRMLDSAATGPATSMSIFAGSSWPEARATLFSGPAPYPRSAALAGKTAETTPDEVEEVRLLGAGKAEFIRRASPSVLVQLSETTPQDLVAEFGPPDAIFLKYDNKISIHAASTSSGRRRPSMSPGLDPHAVDTDQSSVRSYTDDSDAEAGTSTADEDGKTSCFYNYFHHGFDALVSLPKPRSPTFARRQGHRASDNSNMQPVVTKLFLHGNIPGSYSFNRHRRSRWKITPSTDSDISLLTSEMSFSDMGNRLRDIWHDLYADEEEEKKMHRGMVLNRGWGESPSSSIEILGGFEESSSPTKQSGPAASDSIAALNNTDLFGFPGMLFEVLKNDVVSCLTVY